MPVVSDMPISEVISNSTVHPSTLTMDLINQVSAITSPELLKLMITGIPADMHPHLPYPIRSLHNVIVVAPDAITEIGRHW
jgi:hypothetical protein